MKTTVIHVFPSIAWGKVARKTATFVAHAGCILAQLIYVRRIACGGCVNKSVLLNGQRFLPLPFFAYFYCRLQN